VLASFALLLMGTAFALFGLEIWTGVLGLRDKFIANTRGRVPGFLRSLDASNAPIGRAWTRLVGGSMMAVGLYLAAAGAVSMAYLMFSSQS